MKIYFAFSRTYALILCAVMLLWVASFAVMSQSRSVLYLENENKRILYLISKGFEEPVQVSKSEVIIPVTMDENFKRYNNTIKDGGYDLSLYCGKSVTVYTYLSFDKTIHLFIYDNKLICADFGTSFNDISYLK